jgi:hypothetical protein
MGYTIDDICNHLVSNHGEKLRFVLDHIRNGRRFTLEVGNLLGAPGGAIGTERGVVVDSGAPSVAEAARRMMNGLRMWAGSGVPGSPGSGGRTYFAEIVRDWARSGSNAKDVPSCLGTTLDLLYLYSSDPARGMPTEGMYSVSDPIATDLFNIYCWVFADKWQADGPEQTRAAVSMSSRLGLHRDFWNSDPNDRPDVDQTHHFAGYFWLGARYGANYVTVMTALSNTNDVRINGVRRPATIVNTGDVLLGFLAAQWGAVMMEYPGYLGHSIAQTLRTNSEWPLGKSCLPENVRQRIPATIRAATE